MATSKLGIMLISVASLVATPGLTKNYGGWGTIYMDPPDYFIQFTEKFGELEGKSSEIRKCTRPTDEQLKMLGGLSESGSSAQVKPNDSFWAWFDSCLGSPSMINDKHLQNLLDTEAPEFNDTKPILTDLDGGWRDLGGEEKSAIAAAVVNSVLPLFVLAEHGVEPSEYIEKLVDAGDRIDQDLSIRDMMKILTAHVMISPYFNTVDKKD